MCCKELAEDYENSSVLRASVCVTRPSYPAAQKVSVERHEDCYIQRPLLQDERSPQETRVI